MAVAEDRSALAEQEALILDAVDRFLERDVRPVAHDLEARDEWPAEIVEKMKARARLMCGRGDGAFLSAQSSYSERE